MGSGALLHTIQINGGHFVMQAFFFRLFGFIFNVRRLSLTFQKTRIAWFCKSTVDSIKNGRCYLSTQKNNTDWCFSCNQPWLIWLFHRDAPGPNKRRSPLRKQNLLANSTEKQGTQMFPRACRYQTSFIKRPLKAQTAFFYQTI